MINKRTRTILSQILSARKPQPHHQPNPPMLQCLTTQQQLRGKLLHVTDRWVLNKSTHQTRSLRNSAPRRPSRANLRCWREEPGALLHRPFSPLLTDACAEHSQESNHRQCWIWKTWSMKEVFNFIFSSRSKISNSNFLRVKLCSCSLYQLTRKKSPWIGAILHKTSIALQ